MDQELLKRIEANRLSALAKITAKKALAEGSVSSPTGGQAAQDHARHGVDMQVPLSGYFKPLQRPVPQQPPAKQPGHAERKKEATEIKVAMQLISAESFSVVISSPLFNELLASLSGTLVSSTAEASEWQFHINGLILVTESIAEQFQRERPSNCILKIDKIPDSVVNLARSIVLAHKKPEISLDDLDATLRKGLMPFQRDGITWAISKGGRIVLADDMGLGKTVQAIGIMLYYRREWPLLVVTMASLVSSWEQSFHQWVPSITHSDINIVGPERRVGGLVNIISFDMASKLADTLSKFRAIIVDESHCLKNPDSIRTRTLLPLLKKASRTVLLSGTPALSRPIELLPQIQAVAPKLFSNKSVFGIRYCNGHRNGFGWDFKGASNTRELQFILENTIMLRRTKEKVLCELPPKRRHQIFLSIDKKDLCDLTLPAGSDNPGKELGLLDQLSKNMEYMQLWKASAMLKLPAMTQHVLQLHQRGQKMIVFAHHQEVLDAFERNFVENNIDHIRIDGKTPSIKRQELCDAFQTSPRIRVALLSLTAASTGLTLTAANVVVFGELFWNPGTLIQAEDRAHRIGQQDSVAVQYLLAKGTLDDKIWPLLRHKLQVLNGIGLMKREFENVSDETVEAGQSDLTDWFD